MVIRVTPYQIKGKNFFLPPRIFTKFGVQREHWMRESKYQNFSFVGSIILGLWSPKECYFPPVFLEMSSLLKSP